MLYDTWQYVSQWQQLCWILPMIGMCMLSFAIFRSCKRRSKQRRPSCEIKFKPSTNNMSKVCSSDNSSSNDLPKPASISHSQQREATPIGERTSFESITEFSERYQRNGESVKVYAKVIEELLNGCATIETQQRDELLVQRFYSLRFSLKTHRIVLQKVYSRLLNNDETANGDDGNETLRQAIEEKRWHSENQTSCTRVDRRRC